VSWLVGEERLRVLDLGAGTGKLSRSLVALGHDVVAVEPSAEMLAQLRLVLPDVEAIEGSAEQIPLPAESVDRVVAGQAFHWFDAGTALPEIARVLRTGGTLGAIWNLLDEESALVTRLYGLLPPFGGSGEPIDALVESTLFDTVEEETFGFTRRFSRDELVDGVGTQSSIATLPPDERARTLAAVGRFYDEAALPDGLSLPYLTSAYRARKR
jgi:SAM-dependent methyltransferase